MTATCFSVCPHFFKLCIVFSCCEMFLRWLQLVVLFFFSSSFFSHPVAYSARFLLKPGGLGVIPLLFAWRQAHVSRWVFFISCFWSENTWTQTLWIPHCLTEQRVQLRQRLHVHLLSVRVRLHSFHLVSKWLHLQLTKGKQPLAH